MGDWEEWRVCASLPEYEVSSFGRVRRVPFTRPMPYGGFRVYGGKPFVGQFSSGRMIFVFKGRSYKVHRLVCEAFNGPEPFDRAVVMHIDENPRNNRPENLMWGTQKQNLNAPGFLAYCRSRTGDRSPHAISAQRRAAGGAA